MVGTTRRSVIAGLLLAGLTGSVHAQGMGDRAAKTDGGEVRSRPGVFSRPDLLKAGAILGATLMLMPLDEGIASGFGSRLAQNSRTLEHGARAFNVAGDPGTVIASLGLWGAGLVSGSDALSDIGAHATAAVALGSLVTGVVKGIAGRQRPETGLNDSDDFFVGAGFRSGDNTSFPSGHTTAAFAFAAIISSEIHRRSEKVARIVTPILYASAGGVGVARMYDARHWASDVVLGAGIGTFAGLAVSRLGHADHGILPGHHVAIAPGIFTARGAGTMGWVIEFR